MRGMLTRVDGTRIELAKVEFDDRVETLVLSVLRSGHITQGPMVKAFEAAVARAVGVRHAVAVSNGTASLIAALHVLGVGPGDEVITSPFTFIATMNAILSVGARPRFADIDPHTFTLLPASIEALVNSRTRVLMPVHLFGHPAEMVAICSIADRAGLAIVEDAAQALGAMHGGRPVGSFGLGSFSFYATKNVSTGEGGVLTTDDDALAFALRRFRNQGIGESGRPEVFGQNLRLTDLQAAVGLPQLDDLESIIARRSSNAHVLTEGLHGIDGLTLPQVRRGDRHVFHQYTVRIDPSARLCRDELQSALAAAGVGSGMYYRTLVSDHPFFRDRDEITVDDCPTARAMTSEVLSLPVHHHLSEPQVLDVIAVVRKALT